VYDWEAFRVGDDYYLLAAIYGDLDPHHSPSTTSATSATSTTLATSTSSVIYRWQGVEKFVVVHRLSTPPATDWETFTTERGDVFLVCANGHAGISQLFRVKLVH